MRRVERGTVYFIESSAAIGLDELKRLGPQLHDPMIESTWIDPKWIDSIDPEMTPQSLFHHG